VRLAAYLLVAVDDFPSSSSCFRRWTLQSCICTRIRGMKTTGCNKLGDLPVVGSVSDAADLLLGLPCG
jgi:hypothetical protein